MDVTSGKYVTQLARHGKSTQDAVTVAGVSRGTPAPAHSSVCAPACSPYCTVVPKTGLPQQSDFFGELQST